jgi:transposase
MLARIDSSRWHVLISPASTRQRREAHPARAERPATMGLAAVAVAALKVDDPPRATFSAMTTVAERSMKEIGHGDGHAPCES